jgi:hypothetical protein
MECKKERNTKFCACTYNPCGRKGVCCDCLQYHLKSKELPAAAFRRMWKKTYDRSFEAFVRAWNL